MNDDIQWTSWSCIPVLGIDVRYGETPDKRYLARLDRLPGETVSGVFVYGRLPTGDSYLYTSKSFNTPTTESDAHAFAVREIARLRQAEDGRDAPEEE